MSLPVFLEEDLERLVIAASNLRVEDGRLTTIPLDRIFSAEICKQLPAAITDPAAFINSLRKRVD